MVTPRQTRLVRAPDLQRFQQALALLALGGSAGRTRDTAVLVPTAAAADELRHTLEDLALVDTWTPPTGDVEQLGMTWPFGASGVQTFLAPHLVTRGGLYDLLRERLPEPVTLASRVEREVLMEDAAARAAAGDAPPPFVVRPAIVAEMLALVDALGRERRTIDDFERLVGGPLESGAAIDRGARRLLQQTVFLAAAFRAYGEALTAAGTADENGLRERLLACAPARPLRHLVVTVADRSATPYGLWPADYDLLTRIEGLASVTIVATERMLATGYLGRLLDRLPEIEVVALAANPGRAPVLVVPGGDPRYFVSRDREDELADFAARLRAAPPAPGARAAIVYQQPLPYLALARQVLGASGVSWQAFDAMPLGAEPYAAAIDLVLTFVTTAGSRTAGVALLRSPAFSFAAAGGAPARDAIAAADRELGEAFFLGGRDRLQELYERWAGESSVEREPAGHSRTDAARRRRRDALPAISALLDVFARLAPLDAPAPPSVHLAVLAGFLRAFDRPPDAGDLHARHLRAKAAVLSIVDELARAFERHGDRPRPFADLATLLRGLIEEHTFSPRLGPGVVQLVEASAAPYGRYQDVTLVGLTETEWPEATSRSIFYPSGLLRELGWPVEADRRTAARAAFGDLLGLPTRSVTLSTVLLEDDAILRPSSFIEDLDRLDVVTAVAATPDDPVRTVLALHPPPDDGSAPSEAWRSARAARVTPDPFAGVGPRAPVAYPVTAIDRYRECPFKYFAAQVLRLDEEREDRPGLTPQERGAFVHEVFHEFFVRWVASGRGAIDLGTLDAARRLFADVVDERLERLPESERALERARLVGSAAGAGIGERVFRFEAARPVPIVERLLEVPLSGEQPITADGRTRRVRLRGTADRIDLLADGTLRLLDYKTGKASSARKALQVPVYALRAERELAGRDGRTWRVADGAYLAFGRVDPYVPILTPENREATLATASAALLETVEAIESGRFPVTPEEPHLCTFCGFAPVCRKDYVDDGE
jgi:RecB family exonuclease